MVPTTAIPDVNSTVNSTGGMQADSAPSVLEQVLNLLIILLLAIVMVGMGCAVELPLMWKHFKKPTAVIIGLISQFGIMPLLAYCLTLIFNLSPAVSIALLIQASCPGGSSSNVAAYWLNGDMDLSVTMTSCSTILALGMMPLLLFIYSQSYSQELPVPFETIGITLATLLIPIAIGIFLRHMFPSKAKIILKVCSIGGIIVIGAVAIVSIVLFEGSWSITVGQAVSSVILPAGGMLLGYGLASLVSLVPRFRLRHRERRTVSMETGIQNTNVCGSVILLARFPPQVVGSMFLVPIVYSAAQFGLAAIAIFAYRCYHRNDPEDDSIDDLSHSEEKGGDRTLSMTSSDYSCASDIRRKEDGEKGWSNPGLILYEDKL